MDTEARDRWSSRLERLEAELDSLERQAEAKRLAIAEILEALAQGALTSHR